MIPITLLFNLTALNFTSYRMLSKAAWLSLPEPMESFISSNERVNMSKETYANLDS